MRKKWPKCVPLILIFATAGCGTFGNWRTQTVYVPAGHETSNNSGPEDNSGEITNAPKKSKQVLSRPQPPNVLSQASADLLKQEKEYENARIEAKYQQINADIEIQKDRYSDGLLCSGLSLGAGLVAGVVAVTSTPGSQITVPALAVEGISSVTFLIGLFVIVDSENCAGALLDEKIDLLHESLKEQGLVNINNGNKISFSIPQIELANGKATATIASMTF